MTLCLMRFLFGGDERAGLRHPEERGRGRSGRVQHGQDIVHLLFHRRQLRRAIRETCAARIEHDQARERGQPLEESREARFLPLVLDVREQARDEDEVGWAIADDLVGDVHGAALRIFRLGDHLPSVPPATEHNNSGSGEAPRD